MTYFDFTSTAKSRPGINLTPMIDVVFILIVFFLLVSSFSDFAQLPLSVGTTATGTADSEQSTVLHLMFDGTMTLAGAPITHADLSAALNALDTPKIAIKVQSGVTVQATVDALDKAAAAGIADAVLLPDGAQ